MKQLPATLIDEFAKLQQLLLGKRMLIQQAGPEQFGVAAKHRFHELAQNVSVNLVPRFDRIIYVGATLTSVSQPALVFQPLETGLSDL
jgi:hypothetical protein